MAASFFYDLIIIGAGPAGLTASIYASCFHLKHLVIGKIIGGQMSLSPDILNYPGFEEISGKELTRRMVNQVKERGGKIIEDLVVEIHHFSTRSPRHSQVSSPKKRYFQIETQTGKKYQAQSLIIATGTERRKLNVPGEKEYTGQGVYYYVPEKKLGYEGKVCGVIGGANAAIQAAVKLAQVAAKVYLIYRGNQLRAEAVWLEKIEKNKKIEVIYLTVVTKIMGDGKKMTGVELLSSPLNKSQVLPLDKLFIEIGGVPGTALIIPLGVKVDEGGYVKVNEKLATNIPGIFAAGDLLSYQLSIKQITSAVGLGARAATSVFAYLKDEGAPTLWGKSQIKR